MTETLELKDIAKLMKKEMKVKYPDVKISARTGDKHIWVTLFLKEEDYRAFDYYELTKKKKLFVIDKLNVGCIDHNLDRIRDFLLKLNLLNQKGQDIVDSINEFLAPFNYNRSDPMRDYFDFGFVSDIGFEFV